MTFWKQRQMRYHGTALYRASLDDLNPKSQLQQRRIQKLNEVQELKIQYQAASNGLAH